MSTGTAAEQLCARWIEPSPPPADGAEAKVLPRGVAVWVVVAQLELEQGNVAEVQAAYELPREAVEAAVAYYQQHRVEIDARIAANRAFFAR